MGNDRPPPPRDYAADSRRSEKSASGRGGMWAAIAVAVIAPVAVGLITWGSFSARLEAQEKVADKHVTKQTLDLKLQNIELQVEAVANDTQRVEGQVKELRAQTERQTAEILRSIKEATERNDRTVN